MEQYIQTTSWVKDRSRPIRTWLAVGAAVLALVLGGWWYISKRSTNAAESLAEAFRYHNATVANPIPPGTTGYAFTTQDEKHHKAFEAFEKTARDYSSNREIARYFGATHQIFFEPEKAEATLKDLSQKDSEVGAQSRLALAQRYEATGRFPEAVAEYQKLKAKPYNVPVQLIDFNTARVYEAMGKEKEAADLYFSIANQKDWRGSTIGTTSVNRLAVLAPEKVDQLPPAEATSPFAGLSNFSLSQ